jgi:nucleoid-associated protein YgaU
MGFMDKAKKLAEQAQQKLDEAQTQFNQGGSTQPDPQGGGVRYDEHGRPIEQPPAADVPPPAADAPRPDPEAPPPPSAPPAGEGGPNASPDPFKPLQ